jgi:hypothetical protein
VHVASQENEGPKGHPERLELEENLECRDPMVHLVLSAALDRRDTLERLVWW